MNILDNWGKQFIEVEPKLVEFKDEYNKVVDLGQNSQKIEKKGVRIAEYNTFMDQSYGKKVTDPYLI